MNETWQIGGGIMTSLSMSIMHLSSGTVNAIIQSRLQVLDWSLLI